MLLLLLLRDVSVVSSMRAVPELLWNWACQPSAWFWLPKQHVAAQSLLY